MREIKFRAWDGKLMHEVSELHFCMGPKLDGKGLKFYGPGVGSGWIDGENVHLMQYTGLKDVNGKAIYEGDIVEFTWMYEKKGVVRQMPGYWAVIWEDEDYYIWDLPDVKVIGNIYENTL